MRQHALLIMGFVLLTLLTAGMAFAQDPLATPIPIYSPTPGLAPQATAIPGEEVADELVDITVDAGQATVNLIEDFINRLTTAPKSDVVRVIMILFGVLLLVAGWRIYDYIALIAGFIVGALVAMSLVNTTDQLVLLLVALIGGVIGAALGAFLYYIAVFLIGVYVGVVLTNQLAAILTLTPVSPLVLLIGGLIGGLLMVALSFELLILFSALVGAQMITLALGLSPLWTLVIAVIGVIVQLGLARTFRYDFRRRRVRPFYRRRTT
jgi:hypothetical protein